MAETFTKTEQVIFWLACCRFGIIEVDKKKFGPEVANLLIHEIIPRCPDAKDFVAYMDEYHYGLTYVLSELALLRAYDWITVHQTRKLLDMAMSSKYCAYELHMILTDSKFLDETPDDEVLLTVRQIISEQQKIVSDIRAGKEKAVGALVGIVMKKIKTDPARVKELFMKEIHENKSS